MSVVLLVILSLSLVGGATANAADVKVKIVMDNNSTERYQELFDKIGKELGISIELAVAPGNYE